VRTALGELDGDARGLRRDRSGQFGYYRRVFLREVSVIAVEIREPGPPDVLVPVQRPRPSVAAESVLITVHAAGVNYPDVMQRQGKYPPPPDASDLPGLEVAGTIEEIGRDVGQWNVGDAVCALVPGGGYAELCSTPAVQCLPIPKGMDFVHAAGIPETAFTVWTNLFERGRLSRGETVLVHGGTSGIGTTAIQFAHALGSQVFATAGSDEKCQACLAFGADRAFNYKEVDFVAACKEASSGRGVDVVLDIVGGDYLQRNLDALAVEGRLVIIGQLGGWKSQVNTTPLMLKRLTITASTLRLRPVADKAAIARALHERIWPLYESGAIRVPVHATFPLAQAAEAHRVMESRTHIGKLILTV
jgi:putative PIG3 family NAD(P)H quinone oxidoreductase